MDWVLQYGTLEQPRFSPQDTCKIMDEMIWSPDSLTKQERYINLCSPSLFSSSEFKLVYEGVAFQKRNKEDEYLASILGSFVVLMQ